MPAPPVPPAPVAIAVPAVSAPLVASRARSRARAGPVSPALLASPRVPSAGRGRTGGRSRRRARHGLLTRRAEAWPEYFCKLHLPSFHNLSFRCRFELVAEKNQLIFRRYWTGLGGTCRAARLLGWLFWLAACSLKYLSAKYEMFN